MTGEYVYLPAVDLGQISRPELVGGFGYCQSTNQYKVVQVVYDSIRFWESGWVQVYTLGDGSGWRNKIGIRYTNIKERMVYANDSLYWLEHTEDYLIDSPEQTNDNWKINVFDLADETFGNLPMPPCHDVVCGYRRLVSLNGCLCLCHDSVGKCVKDEEDPSVRKADKCLNVWILKQLKKIKIAGYSPVDEKDDSNRWAWIKEFSVEYKTYSNEYIEYEPFSVRDNSRVLMWEKKEDCFYQVCKYPICYDRDTASRNELWWNEGLKYAQAIPHMNSFVSLKDLGERSTRYVPDDSELMYSSQKLYY